jgi:two-component system, NtrC family, sensor kinase
MPQATESVRRPDAPGTSREKAPGLTITAKLMIAFFGFILALGVLLVLVYRQFVPALVLDQVDLRAESVSRAFAAAALQPVMERNYLRINKIAEAIAALPDVAYAAAVNQRGIAVAGVFGALDKFEPNFSALVKQTGFPKDIVDQNRLSDGQDFHKKSFKVGGQEVLDYSMRLEKTGAEIRVGLFTTGVQKAIDTTLIPLFILIAVMALAGALAVYLVAKTVSEPIRELSRQAEYISKGHLDREIDIKAGGEVWQLAESFKRMQASIRYSIMQLRRRQGSDTPGEKP